MFSQLLVGVWWSVRTEWILLPSVRAQVEARGAAVARPCRNVAALHKQWKLLFTLMIA